MVESVIQLKCSCNNYPWGKQGSKSIAARLCEKTPETGFKIDEDKNYAEMWMGTYPTLPSHVLSTGEDLQNVIDRNPEELFGKAVLSKFGHKNLPFLPKVLSILKALPLQLHPNKELSAKLHAKDPKQFTDPNHKPEIALALGDFEAFVGFKPLDRIEKLMNLEPLQRFRPAVKSATFDDKVLKSIVHSILTADEGIISETGKRLMKLPHDDFGAEDQHIPKLLPRLWSQYDKTDPGTLVATVTMNYLQLKKGQCIYIPEDGIHAYLSGDIIECMARSDNVLNTGFCPAADRNSADLFCDVLTFAPHSAEEAIVEPKKWDGGKEGRTKFFQPPLSEFDILETTIGKGEKERHRAIDGPSILLAVSGKGKMTAKEKSYDISEGFIFFVGQGVELDFEGEEELLLYRSFIE